MLRLLLNLVTLALLSVAGGYFLWGSRLGNLTEALNQATLEQEALRARLALLEPRPAPAGGACAPGAAGSGGSAAAPPELLARLEKLQEALEAQSEVLSEHTVTLDTLNEEAGHRSESETTCARDLEDARADLSTCRFETDDLRAKLGIGAAPRPANKPAYAPQAAPVEPATPDTYRAAQDGYEAGAANNRDRRFPPAVQPPPAPPAVPGFREFRPPPAQPSIPGIPIAPPTAADPRPQLRNFGNRENTQPRY